MLEGEAFVLGHIAVLDDDALAAPSRLPGWRRAHVVGHLARNADALGNLFSWATTGVERRMYTSVEQRAEGIEVSAAQAPDGLRADVVAASARLVHTIETLPAEAWDAPVRTARDRPITAADVPWMRIRETWVHAVDLGTGASFADVPAPVVIELLAEVVGGLAGREDSPPVTLVDAAGSRSWELGPGSAAQHAGGEPVEVSGQPAALLAWLIGRSAGEDLSTSPAGAALPHVPAWL
jgi:maleylpyruvate isomerase